MLRHPLRGQDRSENRRQCQVLIESAVNMTAKWFPDSGGTHFGLKNGAHRGTQRIILEFLLNFKLNLEANLWIGFHSLHVYRGWDHKMVVWSLIGNPTPYRWHFTDLSQTNWRIVKYECHTFCLKWMNWIRVLYPLIRLKSDRNFTPGSPFKFPEWLQFTAQTNSSVAVKGQNLKVIRDMRFHMLLECQTSWEMRLI